jgi:hypothetical protein
VIEKNYGISLRGGKNSGFVVGTLELLYLVLASGASLWSLLGKELMQSTVCVLWWTRLCGDSYGTQSPESQTYWDILQPHRINPETGQAPAVLYDVLYDVKYLVRGDTLAYRLLWVLFLDHHGRVDPQKHLSDGFLCDLLCEEYEMLPSTGDFSIHIISGREREGVITLWRLSRDHLRFRDLTALSSEIQTVYSLVTLSFVSYPQSWDLWLRSNVQHRWLQQRLKNGKIRSLCSQHSKG